MLFSPLTALKIPLYIYGNTTFRFNGGKVLLPTNIKTGQIKLGINLSYLTGANSETKIICDGIMKFEGSCCIGKGSDIIVGKDGLLSIGNSFNATANLRLICERQITIGHDCMFSWDVTLIDTDYHPIKTANGILLNYPNSISIGKHVWIGFNSQILKGVDIPDNSVISACCMVKRSLKDNNSIYSYPSRLVSCVRNDIIWEKEVFKFN